jgi:hypothetical protein
MGREGLLKVHEAQAPHYLSRSGLEGKAEYGYR